MVLLHELNIYIYFEIYGIFLRDPENKLSKCFDDSKSCSFIPVKLAQQFKIKSHFEFFDPALGEGQLYGDAASRDLRYMCEGS